MLRPATPLTLLLFAAFALLLLSVLSTPIIKLVPLGSFEGVEFGVFGYCKNGVCTGIEIGYDTSNLFSALDNSSFDLPAATRKTLSAILIVHPVAAAFTLITFVLALFAHMHSPSHSARYLLLLFIVSIIDFIVCLLAFLVDVLVFVPHMAWGSYLVLAATALVAVSGLVSCAMRRMIVSRKARKKRIAENAEMSGQNFYSRQAQPQTTVTAGMATQPSAPTVSSVNGMDKAPQFMALEKRGDRSSDERIPLTSRSPEESSPFAYANDAPYYGLAVTGRSVMNAPARDDQGNPLPSQDAYGARRRPSNERMRARGGMPPGGYRGRGGHPGAGRGGYPAYGAPPPGGPRAYGPPGRGGYDGPPARGGYGAPPRGSYVPPRGAYGGGMRGGRTPPPPPGYGNPNPYDRRPSPYGAGPQGPPVPYGARPSSAGHPSAPGYDIHNMNPSLPNLSSGYVSDDYGANNLPRAESPPPLPVLTRKESMPRAESPPPLPGMIRADSIPRAESPPPMPGLSDGFSSQATGSNASKAPQGFGQYGVRDSDVDIAGMLALQQGKSFPGHHDTFMTEGSRYSQDEQYVPPRQAWNQGPSRIPSPLTPRGGGPSDELSNGSPTPPPAQASSDYYDDVDPRFANPPMLEPDPVGRPSPPRTIRGPSPPPVQTTASYEDDMPHAGARSPAESERSTFTSISQRGINPRWNPSPAPPFPPQQQGGNAIPRRPVNNRPTDVLLNSNPDFQLPTRGGSSKGAGSMMPGSAYPAGPL